MLSDPAVFDDSWLPRRLLHRDGELQQLTRAWEPVRDNQCADDVLLAGPSGVGKTVLTRYASERVEDAAAATTVHLRCLGLTTTDVLQTTLKRATGTAPSRPIATTDRLAQRLREDIDTSTIVVLDEGDHVSTAALETLGATPDLALVVIVHDPDAWLAELNRDRDRWEPDVQMRLDRYGVDELTDILAPRATQGLERGSISTEQLQLIADRVAGVAREGIQTLRASAEVADEREQSSVREQDIEAGYNRALTRIRKQKLDSLPWHHHVLYAIVHGAGGLPAADLHERYDRLADEIYTGRRRQPISRRARRTKLRKLQEYGLIEAVGERNDRRYEVVDETIAPPVDIGGKY